MGRPRRYTADEVQAALDQAGTIKGASDILGLTRWGLRYYMKRDPSLTLPPPKEACLSLWVRANPDIPLPRSIKDIVEMTGCSTDAVKSYLKRERRLTLEAAKALGDFRRAPDFRIGKRIIRPSLMSDASYGVDPYAFTVLVRGEYPTGEKVRFYLPIGKLRVLLRSSEL